MPSVNRWVLRRPSGPSVTVAICTFRRPSVIKAVESVAQQMLPPNTAMRILVIENDATPSAKGMIEKVRAKTSVEIDYRHVPGQNISIARNAALDATSTPLLAFLDDDERAAPDWLANLLALSAKAPKRYSAPAKPSIPDNAPFWIKAGDYHSNRIQHRDRTIATGYTSNVLMDMLFVRRNGVRCLIPHWAVREVRIRYSSTQSTRRALR